jgi:hypothetical protein
LDFGLGIEKPKLKTSHKTFDKNGEDGGGAVFSRFNGVCTRN